MRNVIQTVRAADIVQGKPMEETGIIHNHHHCLGLADNRPSESDPVNLTNHHHILTHPVDRQYRSLLNLPLLPPCHPAWVVSGNFLHGDCVNLENRLRTATQIHVSNQTHMTSCCQLGRKPITNPQSQTNHTSTTHSTVSDHLPIAVPKPAQYQLETITILLLRDTAKTDPVRTKPGTTPTHRDLRHFIKPM